MSLVKFFTIYDDECGLILKRKTLETFNISAYPVMYFSNGKPYFDSVNTNSMHYSAMCENNVSTTSPTVPADVFEDEFYKAYNSGYVGIYVICPHCKWTDYRRQAEIAAKRFFRHVNIDDLGFRIKIINSKTFAAGTLLYTIALAKHFSAFHCSSDYFAEMIKQESKDMVTYFLSDSTTSFGETDSLRAYRIKNNSLTELPISQYPDSVVFDRFAHEIVNEMNFTYKDFAVSLGYACDFAGNVIGRIEKLSEKTPICTIQYGIPSVELFGNRAVCISLV